LPRGSDQPATRRPIWFGLRPRLLGALVLTAVVTLATAALALLAPLQSELGKDSRNIDEGTVTVDRNILEDLAVGADGLPSRDAVKAEFEGFYHNNGATYVLWTNRLGRYVDSDPDDDKPADMIPPSEVRDALREPGRTPHGGKGTVLVVATRYEGQAPRGQRQGRYFVLEMIHHLNYVDASDSVVRTSFLYAALVGLGAAILLGIALSSRLLRRLRLLRDATRSLDAPELGTLVPPTEPVSDEIGELAESFAAMAERLRQQEDARRAFVATASHELRTPLTSLDGMLELLADDLHGDHVDIDDARVRVAQARVQSRRLAGLAKDLLDLSRLDAQLELRSEPVELVETARAVTAEFDLRARERDVAVVIDQAGDSAWAQADPGSVARIVRIMLDNALAVAPVNSMIEVRIGNGTGPPTIEVADEGPGVPDDERELIFERFQRGSERRSEGGFGLGLAIGSELATRMGGRLELAAAHPGATFRLTLPEAGA
jgi:signal transduction histidine kinase